MECINIRPSQIGTEKKGNCRFTNVQVLNLLMLFPFFVVRNAYRYSGSSLSRLFCCEKDMFYRFMNDGNIKWRKLLYAMNLQLTRKISRSTEAGHDKPVCLIIDDTDAPKSGRKSELIGKIFSHLEHKSILGYKCLTLLLSDGLSQLFLDFSIHGEEGRKPGKRQGLTDKQRSERFSADYTGQSVEERVREYTMKKTDKAIEMVKYAIKRGIRFDYLLIDSWFTSGTPLHIERTITREELESWTKHLVDKTLPICAKALEDAGLQKSDITKIVLVGGMTRMPLVRETVSSFFKLPIDTDVNPDEVVSIGASIQAGVLNGEVEEVMLMDVTPLSLGVETAGGVFLPLIPRNTAIPCEASEIFTTSVDYQEMVPVHVLQGESPLASENHSLARFELWGLPPLLRGMPQIEVSFKIDASGIVSVSAIEKSTKREANVKIEASGGFSETEINDMIKRAEMQREQDQLLHDKIEAVN